MIEGSLGTGVLCSSALSAAEQPDYSGKGRWRLKLENQWKEDLGRTVACSAYTCLFLLRCRTGVSFYVEFPGYSPHFLPPHNPEVCVESMDSVLYPVSHHLYTASNATYLHRRSADEKFQHGHPADTRTGMRETPEEAYSAS